MYKIYQTASKAAQVYKFFAPSSLTPLPERQSKTFSPTQPPTHPPLKKSPAFMCNVTIQLSLEKKKEN